MTQRVLPLVNVEKLYVAKLTGETDGKPTYDTPRYLQGVKEIGFKPKQNADSYFEEGRKVLEEMALADISATINITSLTDEDECYLLGHKKATEGGIIKSAKDIAPEVAILFKSNKAKGVDRYDILYAGTFKLPDLDVKAKEGKTNFQHTKLEASFRPLNSGLWNYKVDTESENANVTNFFSKVTVPTPKSE